MGRIGTSAAWVVFALISAACGNSSAPPAGTPAGTTATTAAAPSPASASAPPARVDGPCGLVTKAEVEAVLKAPIKKTMDEGKGTRLGTMVQATCFHNSDNGSLQVILARYDTTVESASRYARMQKMHSGSDTREVAGLGDAAFWSRKQLLVRRADTHLTVQIDFRDDRKFTHYSDNAAIDALIAVERGVAELALPRLPAAPAP